MSFEADFRETSAELARLTTLSDYEADLVLTAELCIAMLDALWARYELALEQAQVQVTRVARAQKYLEAAQLEEQWGRWANLAQRAVLARARIRTDTDGRDLCDKGM